MKLGVEIQNFKITIGRTVFNFSCKTSVFAGLGALFEEKNYNFLKKPCGGKPEGMRPVTTIAVDLVNDEMMMNKLANFGSCMFMKLLYGLGGALT